MGTSPGALTTRSAVGLSATSRLPETEGSSPAQSFAAVLSVDEIRAFLNLPVLSPVDADLDAELEALVGWGFDRFVSARIGQPNPARIAFEQSYGMVEGDSATVAETWP